MKKRILATMLTLAVVFATTVSVSAAPSPEAADSNGNIIAGEATPDYYKDQVTVATTASGASVSVSSVTDSLVKSVFNYVKEVMSSVKNKKATVLTVIDITTTAAAGEKVTISIASVKAGDSCAVYHYNGTSWDAMPDVVCANGSISFTAKDGFSPFAIVKTENRTSPAAAATTAAKTGETMPVAMMLLAVAFAGVALALRKREA